MSKKRYKKYSLQKQTANLSAVDDWAKYQTGRILPYDLQAVYQTRIDIANWSQAVNLFNSQEPRSFALQLIFDKVSNDALLTSQIENRKNAVFGAKFNLHTANSIEPHPDTDVLKNSPIWRQLCNAILDSYYFGYSVVEILNDDNGQLDVAVLPRTNFTPQTGIFYRNYLAQDNPIKYRELPEYGTWILEFKAGNIGLLNKVVPHVLMKTFAQSCWSELCEIYGIPPRVMKTNTRDPKMLNRAKQMMKDLGAAAWYVIDTNENFDWANPVLTKGEVYEGLIKQCNNEMTLAVSGAIIGQDTLHGSNNKDQSAQEMLGTLVDADMRNLEQCWNNTILPALAKIGFLSPGLILDFEQAEDIQQLFTFTQGLLPFKEIDNDWLEEKFGVKVTGDKAPAGTMFSLGSGGKVSDFFV